ncbi:MAG: D-alanyl-D-alanine carboxypeptidase/D-alanyl-D-alanine-endopeptidase [Phycisphaerae bacterium]
MILFSPVLTASELSKQISRIINQPSEKNVQYGIHVVRAATGKTVYRYNAENPLIPASNMKIITTAAAVHYLGVDYVYKTVAGLSGDTLVIIASGDPLLADSAVDSKYGRISDWFLSSIAEALKAKNISSINDIIIDTTIFDDERVHPSWPTDQLNRWYACETSGLNYNNNCVDITVTNNAGSIVLTMNPPNNFIKLINQVTPRTSGNEAVGCYRTAQMNNWIVRGTCVTRQGPFPVAIERPASFVAFLLTEYLRNQGIDVRGNYIEQRFIPDANFQTIFTHETKLADCLDRANKNSLGLAAESLFKTIAASKNNNRNGNWYDAQNAVSEYLANLKIPSEQFIIDDGSGLSRKNRLSAWAITTVLLDQYKKDSWQMYKDSLAAGGVDGTIRRYFDKPPYRENIRGKTGYISGVRSFSGICSSDGREYIFSIIVNNANGVARADINAISKAIVDHAK